MGSGIAQLCATAGCNTILYELDPATLDKSRRSIQRNLELLVEKNKIQRGENETILQRLHFTNDLQECIAEIVIEAIIEKESAKLEMFERLAVLNSEETIFATNTSSLSVSGIGNKIVNPSRVIGMHFFNPAPVMKLVEVVRAGKTSEETVSSIVAFAKQLGKTPVVCKDSPGFIVNRVARPFYIESLRLVEETNIDFKTIDRVLEETGFKMGPFKLMDLIGNDVNYSVSAGVYDQLSKPERLKPSYIQAEKVDKGELGRKTGKGYYEYKQQ